MKFRKSMLVSAAAVVGFVVSAAWAGPDEDAAKAFEEGKALLAKADFDGALKAYATAAKADTEKKQDYRQQYAMLRQVVQMRESVDKEQNPQKWQAMARALRSFYHQNRIYSEALALDQKLHDKLKTADTATMLAETQLAMGKNADAAKVLGDLGEKDATDESRILLGIALARQKKIDEAKAAIAKCKLGAESAGGLYYDMACVMSLVGNSSEAISMLTKAFETTPPSRLDTIKAHAKADPDLKDVAGTAEFEKALKTASKVKESKCSGGSSCGACPSKGSCGSAKGGTTCTKDEKGACPDKK